MTDLTTLADRVEAGTVERPVLLQTRYEPKPFWHFFGNRWFVAAYFRPADVSFGVQFMWGGAALLAWPLMVAVCDHRKMPSGRAHASEATNV